MTIIENLNSGLSLLNRAQHHSLAVLLLLMLFTASLETFGIGILMPYIGVVNSPEVIRNNQYLNAVYESIGFESSRSFIVVFSIGLIALFLLKNIVYIFQQKIQHQRLLSLQLNIETRLMDSYLKRDYLFFLEKNPAELYQSIRNVSGIVGLVYSPFLTIITELTVLIFVSALLIIIQPIVTLAAGAVLALLAYGLYRFTNVHAAHYGREGHVNLVEMNKWMYQSFGGIKELKILSKEKFFLQRSMYFSGEVGAANMKLAMLAVVTRPLIETIWFGLTISFVLVCILMGKEGLELLPIIVLLAAAAFRIMPALNRIVNSLNSIRQATVHVSAVASELNDTELRSDPQFARVPLRKLDFAQCIQFSEVHFKYPGSSRRVLQNLTLSIVKGSSVGFVGPSGAGKTTAVDLLLGLLTPECGQILVDGLPLNIDSLALWQKKFGYVPQSIYLSDDTILNNIAFGQLPDEIDRVRLMKVVEQSRLSDLVATLPHGLETMVGDRGVRLSGGQRQRIGIARALYLDPPILVFDEATSALDNETEREITSAIRDLSGSKTIVLIAHRLSTVAHCDQIAFLVDGTVHAKGTFKHLIEHCEEFRRFALVGQDT